MEERVSRGSGLRGVGEAGGRKTWRKGRKGRREGEGEERERGLSSIGDAFHFFFSLSLSSLVFASSTHTILQICFK